MKRVLTGLMLLAILFTACKKDRPGNNNGSGQVDPPPPPPPPPPPTPTDTARWNIRNVVPATAADVWFTDPQTGLLTNDDGIFRSIDSGKTWTKVEANAHANLFFLNAQYGYANSGNFSYTKDGGLTWRKMNTPGGGEGLDAFFTSPAIGYHTTMIGLYKTTDTGKTWQQVYSGQCNGLYFFDNNNGWINASGKFYKTVNGGVNWQYVSEVPSEPLLTLSTLLFTDATHVKFNTSSNFYKSDDGGLTWTAKLINGTVTDIHFVSNDIGYLCTQTSIYKTTDGGNTWNVESMSPPTNFIWELFMLDANNGWAVGDGGIFKRKP